MSTPYPPNSPYGAPPAPQPYGYPPQAPAQPAGYGYPAAPAPAPQPAGYGYPAPGPAAPPPPAAPYGQPGYGAEPAYGAQPAYGPQPGYGGAAGGGPACRICGGFPAIDATVRAHRGLIILLQFRRAYGPFCHTCGMATLRDMSAQTLFQGWWSPLGGLLTLITLLRNLGPYNKFKVLPPPVPGTHGPQLDPGKPLTNRPAILMLGLPVVWFVFLIVSMVISASLHTSAYDTPPYRAGLPSYSPSPFPSFSPSPYGTRGPSGGPTGGPTGGPSGGSSGGGLSQQGLNLLMTGDCVRNAGTHADPNLAKVPCSGSSAQFKILGKLYGTTDHSGCSKYPAVTDYFSNMETGNDWVLCMQQIGSGPSS